MDAGAPLSFDAIPMPTPPGAPLAVEIVPAPDPWQVARKLAHLPHLLFLDSAEKHGQRGRYSYVAANPDMWADDSLCDVTSVPFQDAALMTNYIRLETLDGLPPFQGGLAGLFGYGLNRTLESRVPADRFDEFPSPKLALGVYDWVLSFDHETRARGASRRASRTATLRMIGNDKSRPNSAWGRCLSCCERNRGLTPPARQEVTPACRSYVPNTPCPAFPASRATLTATATRPRCGGLSSTSTRATASR